MHVRLHCLTKSQRHLVIMNPMIKKKQELVYIALAGFTVTFNTFEQTIVLVLHGGISVAPTLAQNASVHLSLRLSNNSHLFASSPGGCINRFLHCHAITLDSLFPRSVHSSLFSSRKRHDRTVACCQSRIYIDNKLTIIPDNR